MMFSKAPANKFQSTPSARRATWTATAWTCTKLNFNPRPPRGGRRYPVACERLEADISIHALREEGDLSIGAWRACPSGNFNPRPPRGGRQPLIRLYNPDNKISIHALREESDQRSTGMEPDAEYFNPRPPRGERHSTYGQKTKKEKFQSTPSARRATYCFFNKFFFKVISIHALREESDFGQTLEGSANIDFNPRPPRGGRPQDSC